MPKDFSTMEDSNRSSNPSIHEVSNPARRQILKGGSLEQLSDYLLLFPAWPLFKAVRVWEAKVA